MIEKSDKFNTEFLRTIQMLFLNQIDDAIRGGKAEQVIGNSFDNGIKNMEKYISILP